MKSKALVFGAMVFVLALVIGGWAVSGYNQLATLDQGVRAAWGQVENVYQRRADLIPNLVATVKGSADFERETLREVTEARSRAAGAAQTPPQDIINDPTKFQQFQRAQQDLSSALGRLMVVVERYPDIKSTANFRDLQTQLEGTENRVAVERMRFNEAAELFNAKRARFPTMLIASLAGSRFNEKPYFTAQPGASSAPQVRF